MTETFTLGRWTEAPYTSYDKRHVRVQHRVRVLVYDSGFVDVEHEKREDDGNGIPDDWDTVETLEIRDHGTRHIKGGGVA